MPPVENCPAHVEHLACSGAVIWVVWRRNLSGGSYRREGERLWVGRGQGGEKQSDLGQHVEGGNRNCHSGAYLRRLCRGEEQAKRGAPGPPAFSGGRGGAQVQSGVAGWPWCPGNGSEACPSAE